MSDSPVCRMGIFKSGAAFMSNSIVVKSSVKVNLCGVALSFLSFREKKGGVM